METCRLTSATQKSHETNSGKSPTWGLVEQSPDAQIQSETNTTTLEASQDTDGRMSQLHNDVVSGVELVEHSHPQAFLGSLALTEEPYFAMLKNIYHLQKNYFKYTQGTVRLEIT